MHNVIQPYFFYNDAMVMSQIIAFRHDVYAQASQQTFLDS